MIIPDHYIFTADARANRNVDILRCAAASCPPLSQSYLSSSYKNSIPWTIASLKAGELVLQRRMVCCFDAEALALACRDVVKKYGIKYFYDITDRSDFRANPDYKGVCHVALAQEGHCKPGTSTSLSLRPQEFVITQQLITAPLVSVQMTEQALFAVAQFLGADMLLCAPQGRCCLGPTRTHAMRALLGSSPPVSATLTQVLSWALESS